VKSPVLTLLSVALLVAATGCTNKGSVMGSVSAEEDSRPVREARVVMVPVGGDKEYSTTADWGGNYSMHVKEGDYRISAQHPGLELCGNGNTIVEIRGNKVATVDLCLAKIKPEETNAPVAPTAPPAAETPSAEQAPADQAQPADASQTIEVTPLPATEAPPATETAPAATSTPSQFPPSAAPTFPPAPVTTSQTH